MTNSDQSYPSQQQQYPPPQQQYRQPVQTEYAPPTARYGEGGRGYSGDRQDQGYNNQNQPSYPPQSNAYSGGGGGNTDSMPAFYEEVSLGPHVIVTGILTELRLSPRLLPFKMPFEP